MYFGESTSNEVEALRDAFNFVGCGDCVHHIVRADIPGVESRCMRIDHKALKFYTPWFKSYDCGQHSACMCRDFAPKEWIKYLHENWLGTDAYVGEVPGNKTISLTVGNDDHTKYKVSMRRFYDGTFITPDLKMLVVGKWYYRKSRKSPTGYKLIDERFDKPAELDFLSMSDCGEEARSFYAERYGREK